MYVHTCEDICLFDRVFQQPQPSLVSLTLGSFIARFLRNIFSLLRYLLRSSFVSLRSFYNRISLWYNYA